MRVLKVKVLEVNGFDVCGKDENEIMFYLSDIPDESIHSFRRKGDYYVVALGREFKNEGCKELRHMKINQLFTSEEEAELFINERILPTRRSKGIYTFQTQMVSNNV